MRLFQNLRQSVKQEAQVCTKLGTNDPKVGLGRQRREYLGIRPASAKFLALPDCGIKLEESFSGHKGTVSFLQADLQTAHG